MVRAMIEKHPALRNPTIQMIDSGTSAETAEAISQADYIACAKNAAAIQLIRGWLADESGYDERVWSRVKKAIEESRPSTRRRFRE